MIERSRHLSHLPAFGLVLALIFAPAASRAQHWGAPEGAQFVTGWIGSVALGFVVIFAAGWVGATLNRPVARPALTPTALPGPRSVEAGAPVGYPDTRAGARAAAANFVTALNGAPSRDLSNRQALIDAIAAAQERANLATQLAGNDRVF